MSERFVTTSPDGSRDTLYERRNALSRDLLGDTNDKQREARPRRGRELTPAKATSASGRRKPRVPEMALGMVLVIGGALAASVLAGKQTETVRVVAAARDIDRGRALVADDLTLVEVESRFASTMMLASDAASAIGRTPSVDLPTGIPILPTLLRSTPTIGENEEVVALRIEVGDVPNSVGVGDLVRVVLVPDPSLSIETAPTEFEEPVRVWDVLEPSESSTDYVVSLVVPKDFLAKSALSDRSKISLVAEESPEPQ